MAKLSAINKNLTVIKLVEQKKQKRLGLKKQLKNKDLSLNERFKIQIALADMPRNSSRTRIRNRCAVTGRPRAYFRDFGVSRIALRDLASFGLIPGVTKSSW